MRGIDRATLFRICSWADDGEVERAGKKAESLLSEGTYDYQLVVLWLAYRFLQDGVSGLERIVEAAQAQLVTDLEGVASVDVVSAAQTLDRAFSWLMINLTQRVHFHCRTRDEVWSRWVGVLRAESVEELAACVERVTSKLDDALSGMAEPRSSGELRKLERRFRGGFGAIVEELGVRSEEERGPVSAPVLGTSEPGEEHLSTGGERQEEASMESSAPRGGQRFGSERLWLLQRKLDGFQRFVEHGALREAGIVARDVERELAQFDPLQYLPELFADYLSILCEVGGQLEEYMREGDGLEERALERLYLANPLQFMERASEAGSE